MDIHSQHADKPLQIKKAVLDLKKAQGELKYINLLGAPPEVDARITYFEKIKAQKLKIQMTKLKLASIMSS